MAPTHLHLEAPGPTRVALPPNARPPHLGKDTLCVLSHLRFPEGVSSPRDIPRASQKPARFFPTPASARSSDTHRSTLATAHVSDARYIQGTKQ